MDPDNDRSAANERRFGGREGCQDRRAAGQARERIIATREDQVAARETLVHAREHAASLRDAMNRQREAAVAHRENMATNLELHLREADGVQQALEIHMARLRQANEHLVITALQAQTMTEEVQLAKDQMVHMVHHDFLTGLPNRALLMERLAQAIAIARRQGTRLAVLFADLDRFKVVNDSLGHAAGDLLLQTVSKRLLQVIRSSDTACRLGGDEFVVVLTEVTNERAVSEIADKMRRTIGEPYQLGGHTAYIGVTIGVSLFPDDGGDAESLIRNADVAMYHGKHSGRDTCNFFRSQMNVRASERQRTEADLHQALQRGEFELHYQARIALENGTLTGAEALLRWQHPLLGEVLPVRFIPVAEECGLIVSIGRWVLREACRQAMAWRGAGLTCGIISVNLSALEFRHADFLANLRGILADSGLPPGQLELEITEGVLMRDADASAALLRELKQIGVLLAVDDFGTGYSSLSYLNQFPIDVLKIDQSFVRDIGVAPGGGVIVSAVIAIGGSLGQRVVAEGVENPAQLQFLRARRCDEGQGFLFSRPLPPDQFAQLLARPGACVA
ncbi:diguanylate cyclase [Massilia sp. Root351]|jgi:diguanylate cyclase (GGDEF)-like protein|uniref:putative bifunctional diguanylate cyclase/phosphodiesterase n=1 Tax=Massilia sp. Root351 TaxID=1736522 RepID=UPI00070D1247|nr:EAL domain-containing protein [Massilia sp. Root351]KQV81046.1 diguanylate cyclase [Massilia sp. Root351]